MSSLCTASPITSQVDTYDVDKALKKYEGNTKNLFWASLPPREKELVVLMDVVHPMPEDGPEEVIDVFLVTLNM